MRRRAFLGAVGGAVAAGLGVTSVAGQSDEFGPLGSVDVSGAKEAVPGDDGAFAYVATTDGFAVVDVRDPRNPSVVAERTGLLSERENGPLEAVWDVKVDGGRLVAVGPSNPGDEKRLHGAAVFDVSDPASPARTGFFETDYAIHNCFVRDDHLYLTGNDVAANPLVVVDVSGDPREVGRWSLFDADDAWRDVNPWLRWNHDVWVGDGRAYVALWDAGTWVLDVSDPTAISVAARLGGRDPRALADVTDDESRAHVVELPGNSHYAMPGDDGSFVAVNAEAWDRDSDDNHDGGPGGIDLWRVGDGGPRSVGRVAAPTLGGPSGTDAQFAGAARLRGLCHGCQDGRDGVWRTAHNFDFVGNRLYTSWYQGGVRVLDVSEPESPRELASWRDPEAASFWTAKRATPEFFVAPSMDYRGQRGALYAFPVPDGEASGTLV
jgi:hypothetical protein